MLCTVSSAWAQCKVASDGVDEFTGKRTVILKGGYVGAVLQMLVKSDSSYFLYLSTAQDVGCARTGESKVLMKLDDGSVIDLVHVGKLNCKGTFTIKVDDYMEELTSHNVTTIRLIGTRSQHTEELKKGQDTFSKGLTCLTSL